MGSTDRTRPLVAAGLCLPAPGLGHLYLRRWVRGVGWLLASYAAFLLTAPAGLQTLEGLMTLDPTAAASLWPVLAVHVASAVDAYGLATLTVDDPSGAPEAPTCPHCGEELDPEIDFCPWCTTELTEAAAGADRDGDRR